MAKTRHDEQQSSSRMPLVVMAIGVLLVAALVVWALTRTVDTSTVTSTTPAATTMPGSATAGTTTAAQQTGTVDDEEVKRQLPRIAVEDLKNDWTKKSVTIIDVRHKDQFAAGHIPGSINIPLASVESEISSLPKNKPIVTYCT